jgi:hypothetical protein
MTFGIWEGAPISRGPSATRAALPRGRSRNLSQGKGCALGYVELNYRF